MGVWAVGLTEPQITQTRAVTAVTFFLTVKPRAAQRKRDIGQEGETLKTRFQPDLPAGGAEGAGPLASPASRGAPPGTRSPSCRLSGAGAVGPRPRPSQPCRSAPHLEHGWFKVTATSPWVTTQAWLLRHLSRGVAGRQDTLCPGNACQWGRGGSVEGSERQKAGVPSSWHVAERNEYHEASKTRA